MRTKLETTEARALSRELREGEGVHLRNRRINVGLSILAAASMGLITLYQIGLLRRLPEPPLPGFDAEEVDASAEAYQKLATPDAALGLLSYAASVVLGAAGPADRYRTIPALPLLLAAKSLFDALNAGKLTVDQWTRHRAFCFWCLLAAGATFASVPLTLPEARAALESLQNR